MLNKTFATGLLLIGSTFGLMEAAPAATQSALAQQGAAQQSTAQPSTKSSAAKAAAKPAAKPAAVPTKKSAPKPLVYVMDNRSSSKTADAKTADAKTADAKTADATTSKPAASVKNASATSASKSAASKTTPAAATTEKPLSADVTKAFQQNCPSVALTDSKAKAAYDVMFERDPGSKGVKSAFGLHKASKIEVMSKTGKELFSETGHSTGQLVKDACTAIGTPGTKIAKN
jgi:hypothetical protein